MTAGLVGMADARASAAVPSWGNYIFRGGIACIAIVHILTSTQGAVPYGLRVGPIQLYLFDLLTIAFGIAGAIMFIRRLRTTWLEYLLIGVVLLSLVQLIRGLAEYGTAAGVEFRQDAFVLAGLLFLQQAAVRLTRREFALMCAAFGCAALIVYFSRLFGLVPLSLFDIIYNRGTFREWRFVGADEALGIFALSLACFSLAIRGAGKGSTFLMWCAGASAMLLSFVAMHRSVWVAGAAASVTFIFLQIRYRIISQGVFSVLTMTMLFAALLVTIFVFTSTTIQQAIAEATSQYSTLNWRTEGWQGLIDRMTPLNYVIGHGYGSDYTRWVVDQYIANSAHNFYLAKLWQHGVIGVALYSLLYAAAFVGLFRIAKRPADTEQRALAVLLISLLVCDLTFFMAYANWISSIFDLGYALALIRQVRLRRNANFVQRVTRTIPSIGVMSGSRRAATSSEE